jgi:hypothetical protein
MNPKSATALLGVAILVGGELASEHSHALVPREHVHPEMRTEPVGATTVPISASGSQGGFDPSAPQKKFDRLYRKLQKANVECDRTSDRSNAAYTAYHWTASDDGWKWKKALATRDKHAAASKKAEDAFTALIEFQRELLA